VTSRPWVVVLAASLLLNAGLLLRRSAARRSAPSPAAEDSEPPAPAAPPAGGAAPGIQCQDELARAERELEQVKDQVRRSGPLPATFRLGQADPAATHRVQEAIEVVRRTAPVPADSVVECRSAACRVQVLEDPGTSESFFETVFRAPRVREMSSEVMRGASTLVKDVASGKLMRRSELLLKVKS
jgi:hypothetical protein